MSTAEIITLVTASAAALWMLARVAIIGRREGARADVKALAGLGAVVITWIVVASIIYFGLRAVGVR